MAPRPAAGDGDPIDPQGLFSPGSQPPLSGWQVFLPQNLPPVRTTSMPAPSAPRRATPPAPHVSASGIFPLELGQPRRFLNSDLTSTPGLSGLPDVSGGVGGQDQSAFNPDLSTHPMIRALSAMAPAQPSTGVSSPNSRSPMRGVRPAFPDDGRNLFKSVDLSGLSAGDKAAAIAQIRSGRGAKDCGKWMRGNFPGREMPPGSASDWPNWFRQRPNQWQEIPNDGKHELRPGDLPVTSSGNSEHGHVEMIDRKMRRVSASMGSHARAGAVTGRVHLGEIIRDQDPDRNGTVTLWRPIG
jgi:hypothetical protein